MPAVTPIEARIAELLDCHLENVRRVIRDASELVRQCGASLEESKGKGTSIDAQICLLPRVADAMQGVALLASFGHELPALALSSVVYELGHLSAWIGNDAALARTWLEWRDPERMPKGWGWRNLTKGALTKVGRGDEANVERQGYFYARACIAKHGNPISLKARPVAVSSEMAILNADPAFTPASGNDSVAAFIISGTSGLVAVDSFWLCFPHAVSRELAVKRNEVAGAWNVLAEAWANRPRPRA